MRSTSAVPRRRSRSRSASLTLHPSLPSRWGQLSDTCSAVSLCMHSAFGIFMFCVAFASCCAVCSWSNTPETTLLWQLVHAGDLPSLKSLLYREPSHVHLRAEDGRGPLFWAYEYDKTEIIDFLLERGADAEALDVNSQKPNELSQQREEL